LMGKRIRRSHGAETITRQGNITAHFLRRPTLGSG
jgi:hypothetical protein